MYIIYTYFKRISFAQHRIEHSANKTLTRRILGIEKQGRNIQQEKKSCLTQRS